MYYQIGNNLTGPYSAPITSLEKAREVLESEVSAVAEGAIQESGGKLSREKALEIARDHCWLCDENETIIN